MEKYKAIFVFLVCFFIVGNSNMSNVAYAENMSYAIDYDSLFPYEYISAERFVEYAKENCLGIPYVSGGRSTRGFDCCGLVWYVCNHFGIDIGNGNQRSQIKYGAPVSYSISNIDVFCENLMPGDLIFFDYQGDGKSDHVGIYSGNQRIIQAQSPGYNSVNSKLSMTWLNGKSEYKFTCAVRRLKELTPIKIRNIVPEACELYQTCLFIDITQKTTIKSFPCSKSTNSQSKDIETALQSMEYGVLGLVENSVGNYWYMVLLNSRKIGFIFAGHAKPGYPHQINEHFYYSFDGYNLTKGGLLS